MFKLSSKHSRGGAAVFGIALIVIVATGVPAAYLLFIIPCMLMMGAMMWMMGGTAGRQRQK